MTRTIVTTIVLLGLAGGTAMAQPPAPPAGGAPGAPGGGQGRGGGMAAIERDKDGNILKDTWVKAGRPADRFDAADKNKDGKLSPDELQALRGAGGGRGPGGGQGGGERPPAPPPPPAG